MGILPILPVVPFPADNLPLIPDWSGTVDIPLTGWEVELATGGGRIVVFADGGCERAQYDCRFRKAGCGGFWGPDHPRNFSFPFEGPPQSNNRAELTAVLRVLQTEPRPLEIRPDSEVVESGLRILLVGGGFVQLRIFGKRWLISSPYARRGMLL